jgi:hypothetical protein
LPRIEDVGNHLGSQEEQRHMAALPKGIKALTVLLKGNCDRPHTSTKCDLPGTGDAGFIGLFDHQM